MYKLEQNETYIRLSLLGKRVKTETPSQASRARCGHRHSATSPFLAGLSDMVEFKTEGEESQGREDNAIAKALNLRKSIAGLSAESHDATANLITMSPDTMFDMVDRDRSGTINRAEFNMLHGVLVEMFRGDLNREDMAITKASRAKRRARLGLEGRRHAQAHFARDRPIAQLQDIYETLYRESVKR